MEDSSMAIVMAKTHFDFPSVTGLQQIQTRQINFGRVRNVAVTLQGFDIKYTNGDHHLLEESIRLSAFVLPNGVVDVSADLLLRDSSGNIDDPYSGSIDAVVIADVV
jgi:hypothetical protein